jgi:hypothetical protein
MTESSSVARSFPAYIIVVAIVFSGCVFTITDVYLRTKPQKRWALRSKIECISCFDEEMDLKVILTDAQ